MICFQYLNNMSLGKVQIYKFNLSGEVDLISEIDDIFNGCFSIWNYFDEKYLEPIENPYTVKNSLKEKRFFRSYDLLKQDSLKEIFELFDTDKLTRNEKIILGSTFDRIIVKKENIEELINAFNSFDFDSNLKEQSKIISEEFKKDKNLLGICWNQNSNRNNWIMFDDNGNEYKYNLKLNIHINLFKII